MSLSGYISEMLQSFSTKIQFFHTHPYSTWNIGMIPKAQVDASLPSGSEGSIFEYYFQKFRTI